MPVTAPTARDIAAGVRARHRSRPPGFPALSLPLGGTHDALGSVQLVAAPGREAALIALATTLEQASTKDISGRAAGSPSPE